MNVRKSLKIMFLTLVGGILVTASVYAQDMDVTMDVVHQSDADNISEHVMNRIDMPESAGNATMHGDRDQHRDGTQDWNRTHMEDSTNHEEYRSGMHDANDAYGEHRDQMHEAAGDAMESRHQMQEETHQMRQDAGDMHDDSTQVREDAYDTRDETHQVREDINDVQQDVHQMRDGHGMN